MMRFRRNWKLAIVTLGAAATATMAFVSNQRAAHAADASSTSGKAAEVRFNRDVRPILTDNCFRCHGPDPGTRKGGVRFDRKEGLFEKGKHDAPIVAGHPEQSPLYQRVISKDEDEMMPPPETHKSLSAEQRDVLKRWIEQGAPWEQHWSFIAPSRPALPDVKDKKWVRNPIDNFVLAKLEAAGLAPAPEADRRTLARRLALDLIGLPPEPADVEAFINDASPNAYEKLVDKYLASPHYGEQRARYWLDAARYADTHGLHFDNYREMWPYRDWVINAFNHNVPFDRFTIEQLAGDLLPNATIDQQIASGFMRCGMSTNEGGTIPEENLVLYTRDRTETAARVWLGLTMNCCVCHDHKFDPVSAKDFYSMSAFFNNVTMGGLDGNIKDTPPSIVVPRMEDRPQWERLNGEVASVKRQLADRRGLAKADYDKWLAAATPDSIAAGLPTKALKFEASLSDGEAKGDVKTIACTVDGQPKEYPLAAGAAWKPGYVSPKALQADKSFAAEIPEAGDFDRNTPFTASVWAKLPSANVTGAVIARMDDQHDYRGWDIWVENGKVGTHIIQHWDDDALKVVSTKAVDASKWHHLAISYDGSGKAAGVRIYVDGVLQAKPQVQKDQLKGTIRTDVPLKIGQRHSTALISGLLTQELRLYGRALSANEVKQLAASTRLASLVRKPADKRTDPEKNELYDWYLAHIDEPSVALQEHEEELNGQVDEIKKRGAESLVMQEKPTPPVAYILYRGDYDKRREQVTPATPTALPAYPAGAPLNRIGFAQWLVRPEHPLTARVTVNRYWQEIFGTGIVKTTEDFGVMGEPPSHPELLDWLAIDFRESGWDVKHTIKQIVMSTAYRQSAQTTPAKLERDPYNRLVSRGPRFRADAEVVRDLALAASGLLVEKIGGPSVRPYQPPGVWEVVGMGGSDTRNYVQDHGDSLYRRSVYTFWKRMAPPVSMETFNAPSREICTVRRERTDTPLQALVTLNDEQFVEAARVLAQHTMEKGGESFDSRLNYMTMRLLARPFKPEEAKVCRATFDDLLAHYKAHADDAKQLLAVGESKRDETLDPATHAAWTMLANQLMNLDEALNK